MVGKGLTRRLSSSPLDSGGDAVASVTGGQRARGSGGFRSFCAFSFRDIISFELTGVCDHVFAPLGVEAALKSVVKIEFLSDKLKKVFISKSNKHNPF